MSAQSPPTDEKRFTRKSCAMRQKADTNPKSFWARLWCWHTKMVSWLESVPGREG